MVRRASVAARDEGGGYEAVPVIFVLARIGVLLLWSLAFPCRGHRTTFPGILSPRTPAWISGAKNNMGRLLECVPEWGLKEVYCGEIKRSQDRKLGEKIKILGRHPFLAGDR